MQKQDRRVQRTDQLLRQALIDLSLERGYDSVTVQDITDRANLGRATFYLHYKDKDQLLLSTLEAIVDDLLERITPELKNMFMYGETSPILTIFRHAQENRDLYRIILSGRAVVSVERRLREFAAVNAQKILLAFLRGKRSPMPIEIVAYHFANSLLGMIDWWLENETTYSAEYMAQLFYELSVTSVLRSLGLQLAVTEIKPTPPPGPSS
ncbi:MAG TPA: TetR/AcrR family transcriptional regulator [Aggregatilinea sp.]|jgi:AcrR family transcriptional regulator|uniref:TetR/AcrR family transcriptional regulator n=1 Tax=Aggregatilinea sp. TaxID=2806333 RepID=UPI002C067C19|nr:TetR/AcrR family transcriptional regulator [Aggregatilinea sp.]HML23118.1 TetR/AcrR family transcriptional regulator [Aggregatilinea sp.]